MDSLWGPEAWAQEAMSFRHFGESRHCLSFVTHVIGACGGYRRRMSISCFLGEIPLIENETDVESSFKLNAKFPFHVFLEILVAYSRL